jgi:hypothetical protein
MIVHRSHIFGGKTARIHTPSFKCMVSTAKEGLFKKQSTMILEGDMLHDRAADWRPCGKLFYASSLRSKDRLQFHDAIVELLDQLGEEECH